MSASYVPGTPQPPFAPQPPASPTPGNSRGMATTSLVLGIVSVPLAIVPVVLHVGFVLAVLALVFGLISLRNAVRRGIVGVVLGGAGILLALLFGTIYGFSAIGSASEAVATGTQTDVAEVAEAAPVEVPDVVGSTIAEATADLEAAGFDVSSSNAAGGDTVADQSPAAGTSAQPGATVRLTPVVADGTSAASPAEAGSKFEMTNTNRLDGSTADYTQWVDGYNDNFTASNEFEQPDANMKYVTLTVHVTATTAGVEASSAAYDVALAGTDGSVYESEYLSDLDGMPSVTLGAGQSAQGQLAFQVPNTFHGGIVSFGDGSVFVKTN